MYNLNNESKVAILANTKKQSWPLGDYIHILSFMPNLKFKNLNWYSSRDVFKIVREIDFIDNFKSLKQFKENNYDHVINLYEDLPNNKKNFYIKSLFNKNLNEKQNTKNLLSQLSEVYNVKNHKIFFNRKEKIKCKYDVFICWNTDDKWKIKRYPFKNYLKIKKKLEAKYNIKIKIQKKQDSLNQYIQNIKHSKIILSVMTLGIHFSMVFDKDLVALIGPNNYNDLKLYKKVVQILPNKRCAVHKKKLNINYKKCSCMKNIDEKKIIKAISKIYEKIS